MSKQQTDIKCINAASVGTAGKHVPNAYLLFPPQKDRPEDPLDTFDEMIRPCEPLPTNFVGWHDAIRPTITLCSTTERGLYAYQEALRKDQHPELTATFKEQELCRVDLVRANLMFRYGAMQWAVKFVSPQPCRSSADLSHLSDVPDSISKQNEEDKAYVEKARAYLVSAHVFYKVNYALCPVTKS